LFPGGGGGAIDFVGLGGGGVGGNLDAFSFFLESYSSSKALPFTKYLLVTGSHFISSSGSSG